MKAKKIVLAIGCLLLFLSAVVAITLRSRSGEAPSTASRHAPVADEELIAGYRKWTRVNPEPVTMAAQSAQACAILLPDPNNPHSSKFITVYVNEIGRHAMMEEETPHFPQGSIVVKEKLSTPTSTAPELLTVMIKRAPGYNPESGDWEYLVTDGTGKSVQKRGKLENCQACHLRDKSTDYIVRSYLPPEVTRQLK
jgi:hypothetical protein